jgi:hypothetical protein
MNLTRALATGRTSRVSMRSGPMPPGVPRPCTEGSQRRSRQRDVATPPPPESETSGSSAMPPTICFPGRGFALLCRDSAVLVYHLPLFHIRMEYWHPTPLSHLPRASVAPPVDDQFGKVIVPLRGRTGSLWSGGGPACERGGTGLGHPNPSRTPICGFR